MAMSNPFKRVLKWVADNFSKDSSKMLIFTGAAGWALSSLAQIMAIMVNPKIKNEQKSFLIPQEFADAVVNITSFLLITQVAKKTVSKMFSTGKFAPKSVREFLVKRKDKYSEKIGKIDFNLDEVFRDNKEFPFKEYYATKNFGTAVATVGAGILSTNIITPLLRNSMASKVQKGYLKATADMPAGNDKQTDKPALKTVYANKMNPYNSGNMKI